MYIWKGSRRSQASSVYSKTSHLFLVRKESWLEGKKWKREKQSSFVGVTTCLAFISGSFRSTKGNHGAHRIFLFND